MSSDTSPLANDTQTVGFIGGGHMASAIVGGMLRHGFSATAIMISEPSADQRRALATAFAGVQLSDDSAAVVAAADVVVLAVKPQILPQLCRQLRARTDQRQLWLSIAAGVQTAAIGRWLGKNVPLIRAMPNQGAALGLSATGLFANPHCTAGDREQAEHIMSAIGAAHWVDEEVLVDAVTALAGSGPAYVYLLLEAMQRAGEALRLTPDVAHAMTVQTATAAAAIAAGGEPLCELRARVTSPGGTTAAATEYLEQNDFAALVGGAIETAFARAQSLAQAADEEH
ncbi:MAG: pyrroline-5-carboxylate reductase [Pseudomonadota bacterium]